PTRSTEEFAFSSPNAWPDTPHNRRTVLLQLPLFLALSAATPPSPALVFGKYTPAGGYAPNPGAVLGPHGIALLQPLRRLLDCPASNEPVLAGCPLPARLRRLAPPFD